MRNFEESLLENERSQATIKKYQRDMRSFCRFIGVNEIKKELVMAYKEYLIERYRPASVNSMLAAVNSFFKFCGWYACCVKPLRIQQKMFANPQTELTKSEYFRLLHAAEQAGNERLTLLMETICATGIRVSELCFISIEAVRCGNVVIQCKGKLREIFLPKLLREKLLGYCDKKKIRSGYVFITRSGKPMERKNIWAEMKALCKNAAVSEKKVFPHNLRHLFARTYYKLEKDIEHLAALLGHSNINTTRIYTLTSSKDYMRQIDRLGLLIMRSDVQLMT